MVKPLAPRDVFPFVPSCDRELPEDEQTTFQLKPLSLRDRYAAKDCPRMTQDGSVAGIGSYQHEVMLAGIIGCKGFPAEPVWEKRRVLGKVRKAVSDDWLTKFPQDVLDEVFEAIEGASSISDEQGKG